jgi:ribosome-associated protein
MEEAYIELNSFVKVLGWAPTGGLAKVLIRSGAIKVNGEIETRNGKKLIATDVVEYQGKKYLVKENIKI